MPRAGLSYKGKALSSYNLSVIAAAHGQALLRTTSQALRKLLAKAGLRLPASASLSLASCWPRPQQRLPVSAAGGGRRRCSL